MSTPSDRDDDLVEQAVDDVGDLVDPPGDDEERERPAGADYPADVDPDDPANRPGS